MWGHHTGLVALVFLRSTSCCSASSQPPEGLLRVSKSMCLSTGIRPPVGSFWGFTLVWGQLSATAGGTADPGGEADIFTNRFIVRRAGLLWSQQDFEWWWSVPLFKCLTVLEFSFILFALCLLITFFNFIMNYVPIVTFWIFTYHKIWILSIMFCFIWSYWIIYFLACLEVSWRVVS